MHAPARSLGTEHDEPPVVVVHTPRTSRRERARARHHLVRVSATSRYLNLALMADTVSRDHVTYPLLVRSSRRSCRLYGRFALGQGRTRASDTV